MELERKSRIILGIMALVLIGTFIAFTYGSDTGILTGMVITGFLIAFLLYVEGGIYSYVKKKEWKKITFGDILVWLAFIVGTGILVNSLGLIPAIGSVLPVALITFAKTNALIGAIAGAILAVIFIAIPTPK